MADESWLSARPSGVQLRVVVQPRAARTEIVGPHGEPARLKIRLTAPPVDDRANEELIAFLAKRLGVAKGSVTLERGEKSRQKDLLIAGLTIDSVRSALSAASAR